jgi:hypothetical protein
MLNGTAKIVVFLAEFALKDTYFPKTGRHQSKQRSTFFKLMESLIYSLRSSFIELQHVIILLLQ